MRVGLLIDRWDPGRGGAEVALFGLATALAGRGHDVRAYAAEGVKDDFFRRVALPLHARFGPRSRRELLLAEQLTAAAEFENCVTVGVRHLRRVDVYWPHGGLHAANMRSTALAQGRQPDEVRVRGRHRVFIELERSLLSGGAGRVIAVSDLVRDELTSAFPEVDDRLVVIEPGVDRERFHPRVRDAARAELQKYCGTDGGPLLVHAARRPGLKGLAVVFEALTGLHGLNWQLLVAGARDASRWRRLARKLGLSNRVSFAAEVAPEMLAAGADLCVQPTWRDTYGLTLVEALSSGTPVLTTELAGAAARVTAASGTVVAAGDSAELRAALTDWLERVERGDVDPEEVRSSTRGADEEDAFERLASQVEAAGNSRDVAGTSKCAGTGVRTALRRNS